jgi:integrase
MVVQSFVDHGALTRNVIVLVERPTDAIIDEEPETRKSWTLAEVEQFRASVREDRLFACWLLSCYGLRRSEVLGIRWSALEDDTLLIRRSRVAVGRDSVEGVPKSRRSLRDLPLPTELAAELQNLKARQQEEARAFGTRWSDYRLIAYARTALRFAMSGTPTNFSAYASVPACAASISRVFAIPASV